MVVLIYRRTRRVPDPVPVSCVSRKTGYARTNGAGRTRLAKTRKLRVHQQYAILGRPAKNSASFPNRDDEIRSRIRDESLTFALKVYDDTHLIFSLLVYLRSTVRLATLVKVFQPRSSFVPYSSLHARLVL